MYTVRDISKQVKNDKKLHGDSENLLEISMTQPLA